jgi:hypothetical protein
MNSHGSILNHRARRIEILLGLILFVLVFAVITVFSRLGVDFHHDGLIFTSAMDLLRGLIPYKESFSQYNVLAIFIHAGALSIWGSKLVVLKVATAFFYALSSVMLFLIWKRFLSPYTAFLSGILWLLVGPFYIWTLLPWSSVLALFFQLLGLLLFIRHLETEKVLFLGASGAAVALASWCRQPVGVFELLALSFYLLLTPFHEAHIPEIRKALGRICILLAGFFSCCGLFILWFLNTDSLYDWYLQNFRMAADFASTIPQSWYGSQGIRGRLIFLLKTMLPVKTDYLLWAILPLTSVAIAISYLIKLRYNRVLLTRRESVLLAVSLVSISSWHQYYPVPCYRHIFWAASPMVGLLVFTVMEVSRTLCRKGGHVGPFRREDSPSPDADRPFWSYSTTLARHLVSALKDRAERVKMNVARDPSRDGSTIQGPLIPGSAVLTALLLVALFGPGVLKRADAGFHRLATQTVSIHEPSTLSGLSVDSDGAETIRRMHRSFLLAQDRYPRKYFVTTGSDAFHRFFTDRVANIHPLFVNWDMTALIYPEYPLVLDRYIQENRPMIVSSGDIYYHRGYEALSHFSNGASLAVPTDSIPNLDRAKLSPFSRAVASLHVGFENDCDDELKRKELDGIRLPPVSVGEAFSLELLIAAENQVSREATIIGNSDPKSHHGFVVQCEDAGKNLYVLKISNGETLHPLLRFSIVPYQPCHLVITKDGNRWNAYLNGTLTARSESPVPYLDSPRSLFVGSWYSRNYRFSGKVQEVRVFDMALRDREVNRLYRQIAREVD